MVQVIENGHQFWVKFDYRPAIVQDVKANLTGRRWDGAKGLWVVPISSRAEVEAFKRRHGVNDASQQQAAEVIGEIPELPELSIDTTSLIKIDPFHYQKKGIARGLELKRFINGDQPGLGKAQPLTACIATVNGWKYMSEIKVGDEVFNEEGNTQTVLGVFPQGLRNVYKVTFNDGAVVECDEEHLWSVRDHNMRKRDTGYCIKTTAELLKSGLTHKNSPSRVAAGRRPILKWEIPITRSVRFAQRQYLIHPYILGVLIGDGCITNNLTAFSTPDMDREIVEHVKKWLPPNLKLTEKRSPDCPQYHITQTGTTSKNPFKTELERLGLRVKSGNKFIPTEYLLGSNDQRMDLLRGLMDTDGSSFKNRITFHTTSLILAYDVRELVQSLGGLCNIREYDRSHESKTTEYQVNVNIQTCPFYLGRKAEQWKQHKISRFIESIEYKGKEETQCIKVSGTSSLYLTDHYVVTHNTLQSLATVTLANAFPCLVICPTSLKENWRREWEKFAGKKADVMTDSVKQTWATFIKVGMVEVWITNYESLKKFFVRSIDKPKGKDGKDAPLRLEHVKFREEEISLFKSVIVDEIHRTKDAGTQQAKFTKGICRGKDFIIGLTGTPIVNKPKDLIAQLGIIERLGDMGGYKGFLNRYCEGGTGAANLKELHYKLNTTCFFRREKSEVLKDLPAKMRQVVLCDITTRDEYKKAEKEFVNYLTTVKGCTDAEVRKKLRGEVMVKMGILKSISSRGKINDVVEHITEVVESGEKIIVFCWLKEIMHQLIKLFPGCVHISGDVSTDQRQIAVDKFQKDKNTQVIFLNIKAGGVGLTLTASSRVAFVEFPWTYADCEQCEDRAHRIGQVDSVQCTYFLGEGTIDRYCYELIQSKKSIANTVTGTEDNIQEDIVDNLLNLFSKS